MHMGDALRGSTTIIFLLVCVCIVFGEAEDEFIRACANESHEKSVYVDLDQTTELTFCVTSGSPLQDMVFTNNTNMRIGFSEMARIYFTLIRYEALHEYMLTFHLRRTLAVDYKRYIIIIHNVNGSQFTLYAFIKKLGLYFHKGYSGIEVTLTCESTSTSIDQVSIHRDRDLTPLKATVLGRTMVYKFNMTCNDIGRYYCTSSDKRDTQQFLDIKKGQCPPMLCNRSQGILDILSTIGRSLTFTICLIASSRMSDQTVINGLKYTMNRGLQDRFIVDLKQEDLYSYINVTINQVQEADVVKENQIKFFTSENIGMMFNFFLSLKEGPPEFCRSTELTRSISRPLGQRAKIPFCIVQPVSFRNKSLYISLNGTVFHQSGCSDSFCVHVANFATIGFNGTLEIVNMSLHHYGELDVKFGWARSKNELTTKVMVKPVGPPQCPFDINVNKHRQNLVTIRWRPGYDGGAAQTFNITLEAAGTEPFGIDAANVTIDQDGTLGLSSNDLKDDTLYQLKLIPVNKFGNNTGCTSAPVFKTDFTKSLNFTMQWADNRISISLTCNTPSFSRSLYISKHRFGDPLESFIPSNNETHSPMIVTYVIPSITCKSMGTYECVFISDSGERLVKALDVEVDNCPPMLCENQNILQGIIVREGYTPKIQLCLMTYPDLDRSVVVNRNVLLPLPTFNNTMNIEMVLNRTGLYHYINIYFRGPTVSKNTRYDFKFMTTSLRETIYEFELITPSKAGFSQDSNDTGSSEKYTTMLAVFLVLSIMCTVLILSVYHYRVRKHQRCVSCRGLADSTYLLGASSQSVTSQSMTHGTWNPQFEDTVSCVMSNGKWIPLNGAMSQRSLCSTCGSSVFNKINDEQEE